MSCHIGVLCPSRETSSPPSTTSSYEINGRFGASILAFTIDYPGSYRLTAVLAQGGTATLAISQGGMWAIFQVVGAGLAIVFTSLGIAGLVVVLTVLARDRAKRAKAA